MTEPEEYFTLAGEPRPYRLLGKIGEGGMGAVYEAHDAVLKRQVALKFLRGGDPELEKRLLKEARAQARVSHENVCPIYEVGRSARGFYIAMQLIRGKPLSLVAPQLTLEQKISLFRQVAEAVHAAHELGILHRDLKPSNILVEPLDDGSWKPFVTDFGLARQLGAPSSTLAGASLGTPQYMSPEQARGEVFSLDRRSDVFSLGATFYELLTGQPAFPGASHLQVIDSVVNLEPRRLRALAPSLPRELERVALQCLAKSPGHRYPSARALAEDLARYQAGRPVLARPPGLFRRAPGWIARHRFASAALLLAAVSMLTLGAVWLDATRKARRREALARQFGEEVARIDETLRLDAMLPLHDSTGERALVREHLVEIEQRARDLGPDATAAAMSAIGRGYLAMQETEEARAHLQKAWDAGERSPATATALGLALGTLYQVALDELHRIEDPGLRKLRQEQVERELRAPAIAALHAAADARDEYAQASLSFYEKRYQDALRGTARVAQQSPALFEAQLLEGDVHHARAADTLNAGDRKAALADYALAQAAYTAAANKARSDPRPYEGLCAVGLEIFHLWQDSGISQREEIEATEAACLRARQVVKDRIEVTLALADLYNSAALSSYLTGKSTRPWLDQALAELQRATALRPALARPWQALGRAYVIRATEELEHDEDAMPSLKLAEKALQAARQRDPAYLPTYLSLSGLYTRFARVEGRTGKDPEASLSSAIAMAQAAIDRGPRLPRVYDTSAAAYFARAFWQCNHGEDASGTFALALRQEESAFALQPGALWVDWQSFGNSARSICEVEQGRDPRESLRRAVDAGERAAAMEPRSPWGYANLGRALALQARFEPEDPRPAIGRAEEIWKQALAISPAGPRWYLPYAAEPLIERARFELKQGRSAEPWRSRGLAFLAHVRAVDPRTSGVYPLLSQFELLGASERILRGGDPRPRLRAAEQASKKLTKATPFDPAAYSHLAEVYELWTAWLRARGEPATREIELGLAAASRALALGPHRSDAMVQRGLFLRLRHPDDGEARALIEAGLRIQPALLSPLSSRDPKAFVAPIGRSMSFFSSLPQ